MLFRTLDDSSVENVAKRGVEPLALTIMLRAGETTSAPLNISDVCHNGGVSKRFRTAVPSRRVA
jgi:hypothetical protein